MLVLVLPDSLLRDAGGVSGSLFQSGVMVLRGCEAVDERSFSLHHSAFQVHKSQRRFSLKNDFLQFPTAPSFPLWLPPCCSSQLQVVWSPCFIFLTQWVGLALWEWSWATPWGGKLRQVWVLAASRPRWLLFIPLQGTLVLKPLSNICLFLFLSFPPTPVVSGRRANSVLLLWVV